MDRNDSLFAGLDSGDVKQVLKHCQIIAVVRKAPPPVLHGSCIPAPKRRTERTKSYSSQARANSMHQIEPESSSWRSPVVLSTSPTGFVSANATNCTSRSHAASVVPTGCALLTPATRACAEATSGAVLRVLSVGLGHHPQNRPSLPAEHHGGLGNSPVFGRQQGHPSSIAALLTLSLSLAGAVVATSGKD